MSSADINRDDLLSEYLDQLPYEPYPLQEEALLAWFSDRPGVLVCAPTGTGKTLIAEAALFEALKTSRRAYYTTPLIALTEQKFREMQAAAVRWGFSPNDVGLVTGNRRVNPDAHVLVVVAEILLNRLLHPGDFHADREVSAVVMDEFHSFADPERGIVWELTLGLLPKETRLLLLSATVGNTGEFLTWLKRAHGRSVQLVQGNERKVPLNFEWVGTRLLNEHVEMMAQGPEELRTTPALIFCFNRSHCWNVADQLKGKDLLSAGQQQRLKEKLQEYDWSQGVGPRFKQLLMRGVGVHHAGVLPRYRRIVEYLFQQRLLTVVVCTETLAAGINLPARSVVMSALMKGPPGKKKLIDASSAHQIFGRAGRPQYDTQGFVYAVAHEDDVKIARWKERYDQIPEDVKDPQLIRAKKKLKKKMPTRRANEQYWTEEHFTKLQSAPPGKLASKGPLPWRLLAYLLQTSPDVRWLRAAVHKRMMDPARIAAGEKHLQQMLLTLWAGGYVTLKPEPPQPKPETKDSAADEPGEPEPADAANLGTFGQLLQEARTESPVGDEPKQPKRNSSDASPDDGSPYQAEYAYPTDRLIDILAFRGINPIFGNFLIKHIGLANREERLQALEAALEMPGPVAFHLRIPSPDELPPGPLVTERLHPLMLERGLFTAEELTPSASDDAFDRRQKRFPTVPEMLRSLFESEFPGARNVRIQPVWAAGEVLRYGGDFNKLITAKKLAAQEGIVFRHLLRMILLCQEFSLVTPPEFTPEDWQAEMKEIADQLTTCCQAVDPESTALAMESAQSADVPEGE